MITPHPLPASELVLNWHMTEVCNYSCRYCFAKWDRTQPKNEVARSTAKTTALLSELANYFSPQNISNPLRNEITWSSLRLNFAGGEPLLFQEQLDFALNDANQLGFNTSIITNGSTLTRDRVSSLAPKLSWFGISLDSTNSATNMMIGRETGAGHQINLSTLKVLIEDARKRNPSLKIKLNTVVNSANKDEYFGHVLETIKPEKWKVLRMLPVATDELAISENQFQIFTQRHSSFSELMRPEDNSEMRTSYIMIDPLGRFFQNRSPSEQKGYQYSEPIHETGAKRAFSQIHFDSAKFIGRYGKG